ncbi:hypothetical protein, partial [Bifidobacterium subtile]|uniref:hypothetical protein n=1 Tax=Bifidobacterium subtile TaxID=77635 RepID=UPI001B7FBC90
MTSSLVAADPIPALADQLGMHLPVAIHGHEPVRVMRSTGIRGVRRGRIPVATKPVRSRGGRED